jgi:bidirectional [NiFe] hydrogenase diaphorase subunit
VPVLLDGQEVRAYEGETILDLARRVGVPIPSLCYLEGLSIHGGCRLCVVETAGDHRLKPACATEVTTDLEVVTTSPPCASTGVASSSCCSPRAPTSAPSACRAAPASCRPSRPATGSTTSTTTSRSRREPVDASHPKYVLDRDRCVLCTRCVRVCDEVEGAHVWDIAQRGTESRLVAELDVPWGEASSCTWCGKCVAVCPTGALSYKGRAVGEMQHDPEVVAFLARARDEGEWLDRQETP